MKSLARSTIFWPNLDEDLEMLSKVCESCQQNKTNQPEEPTYHWNFNNAIWERLHLDIAGPIHGFFYWLVIIDSYSRWIEVEVITKITTTSDFESIRGHFRSVWFP